MPSVAHPLLRKEAAVSPYIVLFGIVLTLLAKRDVRAIASIVFRRPILLLGGFALQLLLASGAAFGWRQNPVLLELSFISILLGLWANRRLAGVSLIFAGALVNLLALLVHGGLMPVSPAAMRMAGLPVKAGEFIASSRHQFMHSSGLWWLGDWIPLFHFVLSPGDLLVGSGLVWFTYASSAKRGSHE